MKKILLIIVFVLCWFGVYSQNFNEGFSEYADLSKFTVIDSAYMKCTYKLTYVKDTLKQSEKSTDMQILLVGKTVSKYYSQYKLDYHNFVAKLMKDDSEDGIPRIKEDGAWSYELFKNYPAGKETVTDIESMLRQSFYYEEDMPKLNWQMGNEQQTVLGYPCQKATVRFRGRDYTAWFAMSIPVMNGPWKFGGLPGLILKLYDSKEQFVYECIGLENLKQKEPIKYYKVDCTKTTRLGLAKQYERWHADLAAYEYTVFGREVSYYYRKTGKLEHRRNGSPPIPYNPIELE